MTLHILHVESNKMSKKSVSRLILKDNVENSYGPGNRMCNEWVFLPP